METNVKQKSFVNSPSPARFYWIDWMKAIGISLIVYGHFFSLYDIYVYVFSVPLFFLISGFLTKQETDIKVFWKKILFNLVVPMVIICSTDYLIRSAKGYVQTLTWSENPLSFIVRLLIGTQGALGAFWFVYTLIILKIVFQFTKKPYLHIVWTILFLACAYIINNNDVVICGKHLNAFPWAILNAFVAYPFFIIGHYFQTWKQQIASYKIGKGTIIWILTCLFIVFLCGHKHKYVYLYNCGYGDNIFLFLVGGVAGSALIFFVSKVLERIHWKAITDISIGTTLILGFHFHFIAIFRHFFKTSSIADALFTIIIVLLFVPIIRLCAAYVPIVMGKYRIKK